MILQRSISFQASNHRKVPRSNSGHFVLFHTTNMYATKVIKSRNRLNSSCVREG